MTTGEVAPISTGFWAFGDIRFGPDGWIYGLSASQTIIRTNPAAPMSGIETVGTGFNADGAFTFSPAGEIYGIDPSKNIYKLNPASGEKSFVSFGNWGSGDLQFGPDSQLYGLSNSNYLQRLDLATGAVSPVSLGFWAEGDILFAPTAPIPEPSQWFMFSLGLLLIVSSRFAAFCKGRQRHSQNDD